MYTNSDEIRSSDPAEALCGRQAHACVRVNVCAWLSPTFIHRILRLCGGAARTRTEIRAHPRTCARACANVIRLVHLSKYCSDAERFGGVGAPFTRVFTIRSLVRVRNSCVVRVFVENMPAKRTIQGKSVEITSCGHVCVLCAVLCCGTTVQSRDDVAWAEKENGYAHRNQPNEHVIVNHIHILLRRPLRHGFAMRC